MTKEYAYHLEPKVRKAVAELQGMISSKYPGTSFTVAPGEENPESTYISATVDLDDPDEVIDLVIERVLELQLDEGVPVHVVPLRPLERVIAVRKAERQMALPPTLKNSPAATI